MGIVALEIVHEDRHILVGPCTQVAAAVCSTAVSARHVAVVADPVSLAQLLTSLTGGQASFVAEVADLCCTKGCFVCCTQGRPLAMLLQPLLDCGTGPNESYETSRQCLVASGPRKKLPSSSMSSPSGPTQTKQ